MSGANVLSCRKRLGKTSETGRPAPLVRPSVKLFIAIL